MVSRLPRAVREKIKTRDPMYPPKIVCNCVDASQLLYICIPENRSTVIMPDRAKDTPLVTAEIK